MSLDPFCYVPPRPVRRWAAKSDNLAVVPASQLTSLAEWQRASKQLPAGDVLLVVQSDNLELQAVGRKIDRALRLEGRRTCIRMV